MQLRSYVLDDLRSDTTVFRYFVHEECSNGIKQVGMARTAVVDDIVVVPKLPVEVSSGNSAPTDFNRRTWYRQHCSGYRLVQKGNFSHWVSMAPECVAEAKTDAQPCGVSGGPFPWPCWPNSGLLLSVRITGSEASPALTTCRRARETTSVLWSFSVAARCCRSSALA